MSTRVLTEKIKWGGTTLPDYEWNHLIDWGPGLNTRTVWKTPAMISLCFLTVVTVSWAASSSPSQLCLPVILDCCPMSERVILLLSCFLSNILRVTRKVTIVKHWAHMTQWSKTTTFSLPESMKDYQMDGQFICSIILLHTEIHRYNCKTFFGNGSISWLSIYWCL